MRESSIFGLEFENNVVLFECCLVVLFYPRICLIAKFREKMKMSKLGTKNALFRYFWAGI